MKKNDLRLKMIAAAGLLALCALGFTGCNNPVNTQLPVTASHTEHTYGDWETVKAPTCTEKGQKKRKCTGCDKEETAEIDAKGHSFAAEWETDKDNHWHKATCGHDTEKSALGAHADSDSDGKCDACSFDMAADWAEPEFVFSDEGHKFKPEVGTIEYCEEGSVAGEALIAVPTISSDGKITFYNRQDRVPYDADEDTIKYAGFKIGNVTTKNPCIYFRDAEIVDGDFDCYILYDDLKAACNKAKVKMNTDLFKRLKNELKARSLGYC